MSKTRAYPSGSPTETPLWDWATSLAHVISLSGCQQKQDQVQGNKVQQEVVQQVVFYASLIFVDLNEYYPNRAPYDALFRY